MAASMASAVTWDSGDFDKNEAYIACFTNGKPKDNCLSSINLSGYQHVNQEHDMYRKRRLLVADTKSLTYVGKNFGADIPRYMSYNKYCVGMVHKKTGKMKVLDAHMFNMKPIIGNNQDVVGGGGNDGLSYREKTDRLTEMFGSKLNRKIMNSRKRDEIKSVALDSAMSSAAHQSSVNSGDVAAALIKDTSEGESSLIPPLYKEAMSKEEAYNIDDIIPPDQFATLKTYESVFTNSTVETVAQWRTDNKYPLYILTHLAALPLNEVARSIQARRLLYLSYMMELYNVHDREVNKPQLLKNIPDILRNGILNRFTKVMATKRRTKPRSLNDKLLSYILVLCMFIDEYEVDFSELQKDLKVDSSKVTKFSRALGCSVTTNKKEGVHSYIARLKIPIVLPKERASKKKR